MKGSMQTMSCHLPPLLKKLGVSPAAHGSITAHNASSAEPSAQNLSMRGAVA